MEWVRRWQITILYERAHLPPRYTTRYHTMVDTVAQLRALVEQARDDPNAWHIRYGSVRTLIGDSPARCPRGHNLDGGSATRARVDHLACACGGHLLQICQCGIVVVDPARGVDCVPRLKPGQRLPTAWQDGPTPK